MNSSNVLRDLIVVKRSGQRVSFNGTKIAIAIKAAFDSVYETYDENNVNFIFNEVINYIVKEYENRKTINVEDIQDIIENKLKENSFNDIYESFNEYRIRRRASRETFQIKQQHKFVKVIEEVGNFLKNDSNGKPFDSMVKYGRTISKEFAKSYLIDNKYIRSHDDGTIFIHNLDMFGIATVDSYHVNLDGIEKSTILEYTSYLKEILINIKKDVSGVINIPSLNRHYKRILITNYKSLLKETILNYLALEGFEEYINTKKIEEYINGIETINITYDTFSGIIENKKMKYIFESAIKDSNKIINRLLSNSLENLINSLNNIKTYLKNNQYSISLDVNDDYECDLINKIIINILENNNYLDNVAIILKIDKNSNLENINKIIFKNIYFLKNENELEYFPSGQRVYENYWSEKNTSLGKMVNATATINLPRIGLISKTKEEYYNNLNEAMELTKNGLLQCFELMANKYKENYDYLFNTDIFNNIELEESQRIRKIIKNGTLQIGFIGLYESIIAINKIFDESFALEVIKYMNEKCKEYTQNEKLNIVLSAINNKKVTRELLKIDKSVYGSILNITDKERYKDGFDTKNVFNYEYINNMEKYTTGGHLQTIYVPKNISSKKLSEVIKDAVDKNLVFFKVEEQKRCDP